MNDLDTAAFRTWSAERLTQNNGAGYAMWAHKFADALDAAEFQVASVERTLTQYQEMLTAAEARIANALTVHPLNNAARCAACSHDWPCPTVRALAGETQPTTEEI